MNVFGSNWLKLFDAKVLQVKKKRFPYLAIELLFLPNYVLFFTILFCFSVK